VILYGGYGIERFWCVTRLLERLCTIPNPTQNINVTLTEQPGPMEVFNVIWHHDMSWCPWSVDSPFQGEFPAAICLRNLEVGTLYLNPVVLETLAVAENLALHKSSYVRMMCRILDDDCTYVARRLLQILAAAQIQL